MVVLLFHKFVHPLPLPPHLHLSPPLRKSSRIRTSIISSSSSSPMEDPQNKRSSRFMEFPHLSISHRNLMVDLVTTMETTLSSHLLPSSLPPEIQYFQNQSSTSQGSLHIRSGNNNNSPVDCILGSWIYCEMPSGGALNITTLTAYLNTKTDSPRFLIELIQNSPKSLILLLDLPPRKDLIINPDYLKTFYEETLLDEQRKKLQTVPEIRQYVSSSLYIRCLLSPTAVSVTIDCEAGGADRMEEIIRDHVGPVAKELLGIWLNRCVNCGGGREMEEMEVVDLGKRDVLIKKKTVEMDLAASLPRLFGPDVASRIIRTIEEAFHI